MILKYEYRTPWESLKVEDSLAFPESSVTWAYPCHPMSMSKVVFDSATLRLRNMRCCGIERAVRCSVHSTVGGKSRKENHGSVEAAADLGRAVGVGGDEVEGHGQGVGSDQQSGKPSTLWTT